MSNLVVAIDGPAGAGKSTVAQLAAKELNCTYIDTGAMYRAVAWKTLQTKKPVTDELIADVVKDIQVELSYIDGKTQVKVDGTDVTGEIRTPEVTAIVSQVAALGPVRVKMVELQRQMASQSNVLMDGRDIATSVLPNANVKIFLTASIEERARRRFKEMQAKGYDVKLEELQKDIAARDKADSERKISPLVQAPDAELLDTSHIENIKKFGVPVVVTLNSFITDTEAEYQFIKEHCEALGCEFALSSVWAKGGEGGLELAGKVLETLDNKKSDFKPIYKDEASLKDKIETVAKEIYGAASVSYSDAASKELKHIEEMGFITVVLVVLNHS